MKTLALLWAGVVTVNIAGCCLMPAALLLEQAHVSSATQHLMRAPTDYGTSVTSVVVRLQPNPALQIDLAEGASYSASVVPHHPETFSARVDVQLWHRAQ